MLMCESHHGTTVLPCVSAGGRSASVQAACQPLGRAICYSNSQFLTKPVVLCFSEQTMPCPSLTSCLELRGVKSSVSKTVGSPRRRWTKALQNPPRPSRMGRSSRRHTAQAVRNLCRHTSKAGRSPCRAAAETVRSS